MSELRCAPFRMEGKECLESALKDIHLQIRLVVTAILLVSPNEPFLHLARAPRATLLAIHTMKDDLLAALEPRYDFVDWICVQGYRASHTHVIRTQQTNQ